MEGSSFFGGYLEGFWSLHPFSFKMIAEACELLDGQASRDWKKGSAILSISGKDKPDEHFTSWKQRYIYITRHWLPLGTV